MVDVGYFINGRHGVIWNVAQLSNTKTEHLCFIQADGDEQYALKKEDIEYVIPHEEENTMIIGDKDGWYEGSYTEEKMIELCQKIDTPITNAEKFKEFFGFEPSKDSLCELFGDSNCRKYPACMRCPLDGHCEWDDEYKKVEIKDL